jgi:diguanylate cyclase (GGDEF)-like protein
VRREGRQGREGTPRRGAAALFRCLVAIILLASCAAALAAPVPLVVERLDRDVPDRDAAAVMHGVHAGEFVAGDYAAITPARGHGVWYRVRLAADWSEPDQPPVLSIFDPQGLSIHAYLPPAYAPEARDIYGAGDQAGFTRHALVLILPSHLRADQPIYLHVGPERAIPRRIEVEAVREARVSDLSRARLDVLFPSVQLATILVMLCFFLALRDRTYAYFVAQIFLIVLYEVYAFGIGYELPPFDLLTPLRADASWLTAALAGVVSIDFSRLFLELQRNTPRLDRVLSALRWPLVLLALCAAIPALANGWWIEDLIAVSFLVVAPLLLAAGVFAWQQGGRRGGFFLCAWIPGLLFVIVRSLQLALQWPLPGWLEFALPASFAFASIVLSFGLADHTLSIRHERDVAHRLAEHDVLTGVLNRRAILGRLREAFLDAREKHEPLALLFLDLDHFKRINDTYGHRAGDQCLRAVIGPIAGELRQGDALGRYGGEEFLIVLPGAGVPNAEIVAERIRRRIEEMPLLVSGTRIGLTISLGIAVLDGSMDSPEQLIENADAALYRSKSSGRNLVSTHQTDAATAVRDG